MPLSIPRADEQAGDHSRAPHRSDAEAAYVQFHVTWIGREVDAETPELDPAELPKHYRLVLRAHHSGSAKAQ
ncbi:hypothetical protein [Streptomyces sp. NPDC017988]|uniref:hypothetical protein n=1 Tax=Streptomyces sp. NPDC017988 TaxID=3365025 RepID=UPI0037B66547